MAIVMWMENMTERRISMFGLTSKKKVARVLKEVYDSEPHCGGDFATHRCGGNYYDRHNAINSIADKLDLPKGKLGHWYNAVDNQKEITR